MQRDLLDFLHYGVSWGGAGAAQLTGPRGGSLQAVLNAVATSLPDHRTRCERGVVLGWRVLGGKNQGRSYGRASVFFALANLEALGLVTRERRIAGGLEETAVTKLTPALLHAAWTWADARRAARKAAGKKLLADIPRFEISLPISSPVARKSDSTTGKASTGAGLHGEGSNRWTGGSSGWTLTSHAPPPRAGRLAPQE